MLEGTCLNYKPLSFPYPTTPYPQSNTKSTTANLQLTRSPGFGVGDSTSTATAAVLLTVLQESTGRLATILFAHRFGQAIEPECKRYRFLADVLNDGALALDVLTPALLSCLSFPSSSSPTSTSTSTTTLALTTTHHYYVRALLLSASGILRALCGVAAGAAKASLSAHFARSGHNNLAELNAKDGSQETVISLLGMLAGSLFVRAVSGTTAVWLSMTVLVAIHLGTNYKAVRAVQLRTLNRQRAQIVLRHYSATGGVLSPALAAGKERVLRWRSPRVDGGGKIAFARSYPRTDEIGAADLWRHRGDPYVVVAVLGGGRTIYMKEGATARDVLAAWFEALFLCSSSGNSGGKRGEVGGAAAKGGNGESSVREVLDDEEFWKALASAGWDLNANALETGPAIRLRVE